MKGNCDKTQATVKAEKFKMFAEIVFTDFISMKMKM